MARLFLKYLFTIILFLAFPVVSFAQASKIVFTTDPQSVKPGIPSDAITVQLQNSSDECYKADSTVHLSFSGTGEFSSNSDNWNDASSLTMNKGTCNRTFYYKNLSEGMFLITVSTIELGFDANQQITVSSNASQSSNTDSSGEVLGDSTSSTSSSGTQSFGGGGSTTNVSSPSAQLEVSAGSDRQTSPGSPIWFQATIKKNTTGTGPELDWSFGDGNVGEGPLVSHTYKYSGDFAVVLSVKAGDIFSVSRIKIKVAESNIAVSDGGEYLEISNNGDTEINLFNWKLENNGKGFIFQPNTIILPHSSVKFDKSLLQMKGLDNSLGISLKNCMGKEIFSAAPVKEVDINEASKNLESLKQQFSAIQENANNLGLVQQNNNFNTQSAIVLPTISNDLADATNTDNVIYEAPKDSNFFQNAWKFVTDFFN